MGFMFAHASLFPLSASNSCRKIWYNVGNPLMEYMKGERASTADRQRVIPHLFFSVLQMVTFGRISMLAWLIFGGF
jgi:hypothetical protein